MKAVELFAGAGGLGLGVSTAGFEPLALIEWDSHCCRTIRHNKIKGVEFVSKWPIFEGSVCDFRFQEFENKVELVSGGPPCQPFSIGGKHRGFLDSRDMFPQAVRAIREIKPKAFMFENVKGLTRDAFASYFEYIRLQLTYPEITSKNDEAWDDHLGRLEKHHTHGQESGLSYRVLTRVINAADYGVPQKRFRVFFVGFRSDLNIQWSFPEPTHSSESLLWDQWRTSEYWERHRVPTDRRPTNARSQQRAKRMDSLPFMLPWMTVRDAIGDLPDPDSSCGISGFPDHRVQQGARVYVGHTGSPYDEPAKTLKAGDHGVPGGENMLVRPDGTVRYFTVRESARLQTFPDDYEFHGSWSESMRQLGNAVPVRLASIIASSVRAKLIS